MSIYTWFRMKSRRRFNLREFLSKPRFLHEIAEYYGVSKKTAIFHIREAMKSGQLLVSEAPVFQTIKDSSGNLKKLKGFVYVYQESPTLVGKDIRFSLPKTDNSKRKLRSTSHASFTKPNGECTRAGLEPGSRRFASMEKANPENAARLKANRSRISKLKVSSVKVSSVNHTRSSPLLPSEKYSSGKPAALLNVEKIRLFQALLKEPLPFLDICNRFEVSRQTITRLVRNGLLMEAWGSKGVGVRFKLTSKGKACLAQFEEASKYEGRIKDSALTRLKQRSIV
jgi:predicted DNA-binding protein YlxM (UPF0122 family)